VSEVMLHHVLFLNQGRFDGDRHDGSCPDLPRERFFGTGEEDKPLRLPPGYGYEVHAGDRWRMPWMLMNHQAKPDKAYIEYYGTVDDDPSITPVTPMWLDVAGCDGGSIYDVPGGGEPGSSHYKGLEFAAPHNGRIVAGGAHLHGGAKNSIVTQPRCDNRWLMESRTLYGNPDHIYYNVLPVLHEPGPINTSWFTSSKGIPVREGEKLGATAVYDAERPHSRVMAMHHIYVAKDDDVPEGCEPLPDDIENRNVDYPGRPEPPAVEVPLTGLDRQGRAITIERPPGRTFRFPGSTTIDVRNYTFSRPNISIPLGAKVRWRFFDPDSHNITFASGPRALSSRDTRRGGAYAYRFRKPGKYKLMCGLHPVAMTQTVRVR
jgi:hypothetical protein